MWFFFTRFYSQYFPTNPSYYGVLYWPTLSYTFQVLAQFSCLRPPPVSSPGVPLPSPHTGITTQATTGTIIIVQSLLQFGCIYHSNSAIKEICNFCHKHSATNIACANVISLSEYSVAANILLQS